MNKPLVFATAKPLVFATAFANDPKRYNDWISFYKEKLPGVDLLLCYDGPSDPRVRKDVKTLEFMDSLGRLSMFVFPGWKRSFKTVLDYAVENGYFKIALVESDCFLTDSGITKLLNGLDTPGYRTGYSNHYGIPETALQILNNQNFVFVFRNHYSDPGNLYENFYIEQSIEQSMHPAHFFKGERYEGHPERVKPDFDYLCQCTLDDFKTHFK